MDRRRGSPPPRRSRAYPPPAYFDGPPPPYGGRYRSRSPPPYEGGRKRHRRDGDPHFDRFNPRDSYRGRSPPPYDSYYGEPRRPPSPPPPREQLGPLSFKHFLLDQPDDLTPEEAQARYRAYLVDYHGSEIKAEFVQTRNEESVRAAFDPRSFEKALAKRNEEAQESAARFAEDYKAGILSPSEPVSWPTEAVPLKP